MTLFSDSFNAGDDFDHEIEMGLVYDRDLAQDWAMTRMADAEMGDL